MVITGGRLELCANEAGQITSIKDRTTGFEFLEGHPAYSAVEEGMTHRIIGQPGTGAPAVAGCEMQGGIQITREYKEYGMIIADTITAEDDSILWTVKVTCGWDYPGTAHVYLVVPVLGQDRSVFFPQNEAPLEPEDFHHLRYIYGGDQFRSELGRALSLPLVTFYRRGSGAGITCASPAGAPVPAIWYSMFHEAEKISFVLRHVNFRLDRHHPVEVRLHLLSHGDGYKEGLSWYRNRYRQYFTVKNEAVYKHEGAMLCSCQLHKDESIKVWKSQGFSWQELHANLFPFYGVYSPGEEEWEPLTTKHCVRTLDLDRLAGLNPRGLEYDVLPNYGNEERMSKEKIRAYIRKLHQNGVGAFIYINPVLCDKEILPQFIEAAARNEDGSFCADGYYFGVSMNPEPDNIWGRHMLQQVDGILQDYPECDGIFFDELHYRHYDFAHDDGITMVNNKPCSMVGFSLIKLAKLICDRVHAAGKAVWANGPSSLEVAEHIDGFMAEGSSAWMGTIQYDGLEKPMVLLTGGKEPGELRVNFKKSLLCGGQPDVLRILDVPKVLRGDSIVTRNILPGDDPERQEINRRYRPLFEQIKGRRWVLEDGVAEADPEVGINCFELRDGSVAVTLGVDRPVQNVRLRVKAGFLGDRREVFLYTTEEGNPVPLAAVDKDAWSVVTIPEIREAAVVKYWRKYNFR